MVTTEERLARAKAYHDAAAYLESRESMSTPGAEADMHVARKLRDMSSALISLTKET